MENYIDKFKLSGKVAIITGTSKGIGAEIAKGFAQQGAKVVICGRSQESLDAYINEIQNDGLTINGFQCNVGDEAQLKNLVKQTVDLHDGVDILVNCAATNPMFGPSEEMDSPLFDKMISINLKSIFTLSNLCFPYMKKRGGQTLF